MKQFIILILVLSVFSINDNYFLKKHPIHVSVTNIEYFSGKNKFEISFRLFADDFQKVILQEYDFKINLNNLKTNTKSYKYVNKYITEHFILKINDKEIEKRKFIFKKSKLEDTTIWLYYEIKFYGNAKKININNTLMLDLFRDQNNLLIFTHGKKQKALKFTNKKTKQEFNIE